jgi:hypothetical protein
MQFLVAQSYKHAKRLYINSACADNALPVSLAMRSFTCYPSHSQPLPGEARIVPISWLRSLLQERNSLARFINSEF